MASRFGQKYSCEEGQGPVRISSSGSEGDSPWTKWCIFTINDDDNIMTPPTKKQRVSNGQAQTPMDIAGPLSDVKVR